MSNFASSPLSAVDFSNTANPGAEIIDGNEDAYYYTNGAAYLAAYHTVSQRARYMVTPEV